MKTDRTAQYTSRDTVTERIAENKSVRKETQMRKEKDEDTAPVMNQFGSSSDTSEQESEVENTMRSSSLRSHKRVVKKGTTIIIPHDVLINPALVSCNTRIKRSSTATASTLETLISVCGGNPNAINLHHSTVHRCVIILSHP